MDKDSSRPLWKIFTAVPPSYDFLNRLLTLRLDEHWRGLATKEILAGNPGKILDLCTGTGDLALRLRKLAPSDTEVCALDYSKPMLERARKKASDKNLNHLDFIHGDAASMPFSDGYFDSVGIAFAFRNLTFKNPDTDKFLSEILRVLKPGGKFVAVETSQPENGVLRRFTHFYLRYIASPLGGLISGNKVAYRYLSWSAIHYYKPGELSHILLKAGFANVEYRKLMLGIAGIWVCTS